MSRPSTSAALLLVLLLAACRPPDAVRLGWNRTFRLCPPAAGPVLFETQAVEVTLPDGTLQRLLTTVENGPERMTVVASTPMGQTLFTATLAQGRIAVEAHMPMPREADPSLLLALVQLTRWPVEALQSGLGPGLALREEGGVRTLLRNGEPLVLLRQQGGVVDLEAPAFRVKARITPLEEAP